MPDTKLEILCLNHGYAALDDAMGDDRTAARCARTSFKNKDLARSEEQDEKLTGYLIQHGHSTPLEFCQLRFYLKMPILVARQLVRQRTQSINELSLRYVQATREFYVPELSRMQKQSTSNKQGSSSEIVLNPTLCQSYIVNSGNACFDTYEHLLAEGLSKELARTVLPLGTYTEWFCQMNLHNFFHMIKQRTDSHAQYESQVYALAMLALAKTRFPKTIASWEKIRV